MFPPICRSSGIPDRRWWRRDCPETQSRARPFTRRGWKRRRL